MSETMELEAVMELRGSELSARVAEALFGFDIQPLPPAPASGHPGLRYDASDNSWEVRIGAEDDLTPWGERRWYWKNDRGDGRPTWWPTARPFASDIRAAWEVVEAMQERGFLFTFWHERGEDNSLFSGRFGARFSNDEGMHTSYAAPAPCAICRAALAALPPKGAVP